MNKPAASRSLNSGVEILPSGSETEMFFALVEQVTGTCQQGRFRKEILLSNVVRRANEMGFDSLTQYLQTLENDIQELEIFISSVTIHTTSFFRELPHFLALAKHLEENQEKIRQSKRPYKVWCSACSSGEEVYSFACVLEEFRLKQTWFEYQILGTDIDPVSIKKAKLARYDRRLLSDVRPEQKLHFTGANSSSRDLTPVPAIVSRCRFETHNLLEPLTQIHEQFDLVVCRNVLIYFSLEGVKQVIQNTSAKLKRDGLLFLGHSEIIEAEKYQLTKVANAIYGLLQEPVERTPRVLVIDDSELIRASLKDLLSKKKFEVVTSASAAEADIAISQKPFDLITLDLDMPETNGQAWLTQARRNGLRTPVVIVSAAQASEAVKVLGALENGAQEFIAKADLNARPESVIEKCRALIQSDRGIQDTRRFIRRRNKNEYPDPGFAPECFLIGASTGGPQTLMKVLRNLPKFSPPILVVQHISPYFAPQLAQRLSSVIGLEIGDPNLPLERGRIYLAEGDYHIGLIRRGSKLFVQQSRNAPLHGHRPAVDHLFLSAAHCSARALGVLLTGMGKDGAIGLKQIRDSNGFAAAQDEESCVVYGMPKEAVKIGAPHFIGNPTALRDVLLSVIQNAK